MSFRVLAMHAEVVLACKCLTFLSKVIQLRIAFPQYSFGVHTYCPAIIKVCGRALHCGMSNDMQRPARSCVLLRRPAKQGWKVEVFCLYHSAPYKHICARQDLLSALLLAKGSVRCQMA